MTTTDQPTPAQARPEEKTKLAEAFMAEVEKRNFRPAEYPTIVIERSVLRDIITAHESTQQETLRKVREALGFYARQWQGNADGAMDGTPGLTRTWQEPTDELWRDAGHKADEALAALDEMMGRR